MGDMEGDFELSVSESYCRRNKYLYTYMDSIVGHTNHRHSRYNVRGPHSAIELKAVVLHVGVTLSSSFPSFSSSFSSSSSLASSCLFSFAPLSSLGLQAESKMVTLRGGSNLDSSKHSHGKN